MCGIVLTYFMHDGSSVVDSGYVYILLGKTARWQRLYATYAIIVRR